MVTKKLRFRLYYYNKEKTIKITLFQRIFDFLRDNRWAAVLVLAENAINRIKKERSVSPIAL